MKIKRFNESYEEAVKVYLSLEIPLSEMPGWDGDEDGDPSILTWLKEHGIDNFNVEISDWEIAEEPPTPPENFGSRETSFVGENKALTAEEVKDILSSGGAHCSQVTKKGNIYTARKGYFYRHGESGEGFRDKVLKAIPEAKIIDFGDIWKPFKGGAPIAQQSHFYVKFEL